MPQGRHQPRSTHVNPFLVILTVCLLAAFILAAGTLLGYVNNQSRIKRERAARWNDSHLAECAKRTFIAALRDAGLQAKDDQVQVLRGTDGLWDCTASHETPLGSTIFARGEYSHPGYIWMSTLKKVDGTELKQPYWWPHVPPWPVE